MDNQNNSFEIYLKVHNNADLSSSETETKMMRFFKAALGLAAGAESFTAFSFPLADFFGEPAVWGAHLAAGLEDIC